MTRAKCKISDCDNLQRSRGSGRFGLLCNTHHRKKYPRNKAYHKRRGVIRRLREYGLSEIGYHKLVAEHDGVCAICGEKTTPLHIDHCHDTDKVRGLLCAKCNLGLGMFNDDLDLLASASSYLINSRLKVVG